MSGRRIIRVRDVMVAGLYSVDGLATVAEAMTLMEQHQINALGVNRRNEDDELGLVTVADIAREVIARNRAPERVNVYEIMSKPVLTLPSDMQARYAVRMLVRFAVSRALVVDHDRNPLGIVTLRGLVMAHTPG